MKWKISAVVIIIILIFVGFFIWQQAKFNDGLLHVVFCDVGQGDGIFIRTPDGSDILLDGGPDQKILGCLSSHMPFWDRTIELMMLSHPHQDHFVGLVDVVNRYTVLHFVTENLANKSGGFKALQSALSRVNLSQRFLFAGDDIAVGEVVLHIVGPDKAFLQETSPDGVIKEAEGFGNLVSHLQYDSLDILFDGDSQIEGMKQAIDRLGNISLEVLQVPHHGSAYGLDPGIVSSLHPRLAVISVGKNKYGHPTAFTLGLFHDAGIKILRTDQQGEIEIVSDGKKWWMKK